MAARSARPAPAPDAAGQVVVIASRPAGARLAKPLETAGHDVVVHAELTSRLVDELDDATSVLVLAARGEDDALVSAVAAARSELPGASVVLVARAITVRAMRACFAAGVDALVLEDEAAAVLPAAVTAAASGLLVFPRALRGNMARPVLSAREKQVLGLVVLGLTNREIASRLHVSESTVKSHLATSFPKLGASTRREAAALILDPATGLGTGILAIAGDE